MWLYSAERLFPFSIRARSHTATSAANLLNSRTWVSKSDDHRFTISSRDFPLSMEGGGTATEAVGAIGVADFTPDAAPVVGVVVVAAGVLAAPNKLRPGAGAAVAPSFFSSGFVPNRPGVGAVEVPVVVPAAGAVEVAEAAGGLPNRLPPPNKFAPGPGAAVPVVPVEVVDAPAAGCVIELGAAPDVLSAGFAGNPKSPIPGAGAVDAGAAAEFVLVVLPKRLDLGVVLSAGLVVAPLKREPPAGVLWVAPGVPNREGAAGVVAEAAGVVELPLKREPPVEVPVGFGRLPKRDVVPAAVVLEGALDPAPNSEPPAGAVDVDAGVVEVVGLAVVLPKRPPPPPKIPPLGAVVVDEAVVPPVALPAFPKMLPPAAGVVEPVPKGLVPGFAAPKTLNGPVVEG